MKKLVVTGVAALALAAAVATPALASGIRHFGFGINQDGLSDEQKSIIEQYEADLGELNDSFLKKAVENGIISEEDLAGIKERIRSVPEPGDMKEWKGDTENGFGLRPDVFKLDSLTDEQQDKLNALEDERVRTERKYIEKAAATGIITQVQADTMLERLDTQDSGKGIRIGVGYGWLNLFTDESKLTDEQKAVVDEYRDALKVISSKQIDLYVEFGILTEEAAAAMLERIEEDGGISLDIRFGSGEIKSGREKNQERGASGAENMKLNSGKSV